MLQRPSGPFDTTVTDLDRFTAACAYPGEPDEQAVKRELSAFFADAGREAADREAAGGAASGG
jgi:hypothetical protein